jgi:hypothetical protein
MTNEGITAWAAVVATLVSAGALVLSYCALQSSNETARIALSAYETDFRSVGASYLQDYLKESRGLEEEFSTNTTGAYDGVFLRMQDLHVPATILNLDPEIVAYIETDYCFFLKDKEVLARTWKSMKADGRAAALYETFVALIDKIYREAGDVCG